MKGDHSLTSPHHSQHVGAKRAADRTGEQFIFQYYNVDYNIAIP